ncbi:MAG: shikimate dehydrogenase [Spirochaetes bacterium]|nr:shikimate dehydrogenase [Spirochaetota bacterium]
MITTPIPTYLIGHPVSHSKSPIFQNAAFKHLGINSVYQTIDILPNDFEKVVLKLKKSKIMGMNITLPYKHDIIKYTDSLSQEAKIIKAVNTIEITGNKWIGHNTDWYGVYKTLEKNNISKKQNVLLIGAGGATPGVIYGFIKYGITDISITNRTMHKAQKLNEQFSIKLLNYNIFHNSLDNFNMIVNCTSIDFKDIINNFNDNTIYFDLKYYTKELNVKKYIDGKSMLLYQGAKSFSIWTKTEAPIDIMKQSLENTKKY